MSKVSIQIVAWNSRRYLYDCLESVFGSTFKDFSVLVIDNGSGDDTVVFVRSNYPTVSVLQNFKNLGYARAHNQGIFFSKSDYVLVMNPDVILEPDFLERLVEFADQHPDGASFAGKTLSVASTAIDQDDASGPQELVKSDIIDAAGLALYKSRLVVNRGEGERDQGQYDRDGEVFGHSGSCVLFRRLALGDVHVKKEFFDEDFFSYKEDVDLAWRLRLYGWSAWYHPAAVCYHYRTFKSAGHLSAQVIAHRRNVSKRLRMLSFRNHHLMLIKNDQWVNLLRAVPQFIAREIMIVGYALLFEPFQYQTVIQIFRLLPRMLLKRKVIQAHRKLEAQEMRQWFK